MPLKTIIKGVSEPRMKHLGLPRGPIAIISKMRDCVVELVGLEPTTSRAVNDRHVLTLDLSRMRSEVTSRSNWANERRILSVSRPMRKAVLVRPAHHVGLTLH